MLHINFTSTGYKKKRRKKPKLNNNKTSSGNTDGDALGMLDVYRRTVCCIHSGPSMCMVYCFYSWCDFHILIFDENEDPAMKKKSLKNLDK